MDFVKFAQAYFVIEKSAQFIKERQKGTDDGTEAKIPLIFCGDFNSLPVSSVLSAVLGEDILDEKCSWKVPTETDFWTPKEAELKYKNEKYIQIA